MQTAQGDIILGFGQHEITIKVQDTPNKVQLHIENPCDGNTVCHGDISRIGVTIMDHGFILYADVKTNTCCVGWTLA